MKWKFTNQINTSFGSGGMTTALENNTLIEFVQYLQRSHERPMPTKKGVLVLGLQEEGICVLNESTFISADGKLIDPAKCNLVWLSHDIVHETSKVRSKDITPKNFVPIVTRAAQAFVPVVCENVETQPYPNFAYDRCGNTIVPLSHHN